jgi:hypothetical protein
LNNDVLTKALIVQRALLKSEYGFIENNITNRELFSFYLEPQVRNLIDYISEELGLFVFKVQDRLYISSKKGSFLDVNESDIARYFYISKEKEVLNDSRIRLSLFYYITLNFLNILYSGYPIKNTQDYTTLREIIETVDESVERALASFNEDNESEVGFNILKSCDAWRKFTLDSEGSGDMNSKKGFVKRCIAYLKKHGLVKTLDDNEFRVYPERKLTDLMVNGGLDMDRIKELKIAVQNNFYYEKGDAYASNK